MKKIYTQTELNRLLTKKGYYDPQVMFYALKLQKQDIQNMGLTFDEYCAIMEQRERSGN